MDICEVVKSTYMPSILNTCEKPENTSVKGRKTLSNVFRRSRVIPKEYLVCPAILSQGITLEPVAFCLVRDPFFICVVSLEALSLLVRGKYYTEQP
jgi:hypothetical protein